MCELAIGHPSGDSAFSSVLVFFMSILSKKICLVGDFGVAMRAHHLYFLSPLFAILCALPGGAIPLSPGDRIKVTIPEGDLFNGTYEVNLDGTLDVPLVNAIAVTGLDPLQVEQSLKQKLIEHKLFNPKFVQVSVQVAEWAPIQVNVSGATFQPGRVLINQRSPEALSKLSQSTGDYPPQRFLTAALQAAGGVLPTANVRQVKLIRNGQETEIDLSGIFNGEQVAEIPLVAGDQIVVPDTGKFQNDLVRPSQISIPGVRVFISNLTEPGGSGGVKDTTFIYGARLSQALIGASCAGGNTSTARRRAVLVRTNRMTGKTEAFDYQIEDTIRKSNDDAANPFLMPDDGIACYDSKSTNLKGVAQILSDIFSPFSALFNLFK